MNSVLTCQRAESFGFYSEGETMAHVTGSILREVRNLSVLSALLFSFRGSKNRTDFWRTPDTESFLAKICQCLLAHLLCGLFQGEVSVLVSYVEEKLVTKSGSSNGVTLSPSSVHILSPVPHSYPHLAVQEAVVLTLNQLVLTSAGSGKQGNSTGIWLWALKSEC